MFKRHLDFDFEVGEAERHKVAFTWDQLWGPMKISVDGKPVIRKLGWFSLRRTKGYEFSVGSSEMHQVRIAKTARRRSAASRRRSVSPMSMVRRSVATRTPPEARTRHRRGTGRLACAEQGCR